MHVYSKHPACLHTCTQCAPPPSHPPLHNHHSPCMQGHPQHCYQQLTAKLGCLSAVQPRSKRVWLRAHCLLTHHCPVTKHRGTPVSPKATLECLQPASSGTCITVWQKHVLANGPRCPVRTAPTTSAQAMHRWSHHLYRRLALKGHGGPSEAAQVWMGSPTNTAACCSYNILPAAAFVQCWQLLCFTAAVTASLADMALPNAALHHWGQGISLLACCCTCR